MQNTPAFKKAAIDFVLTYGTCESMTTSTRLALADLAVRGVDYDASDMPDFQRVALDAGDTFHDATYGDAFACRVLPLGRDPKNWRDEYQFWVGEDDIRQMLLGQMIAGLMAAAEVGDAGWKERADEREIERIQRNAEALAERERRAVEARAAHKEASK